MTSFMRLSILLSINEKLEFGILKNFPFLFVSAFYPTGTQSMRIQSDFQFLYAFEMTGMIFSIRPNEIFVYSFIFLGKLNIIY